MTRSIAILLTAGFLCCSTNAIFGQQPHHPQITIGHKGIAPLKADLKYLLSLTSPRDQEQLPNLVDFIDLLAFGLDEERPVRVDVFSGSSPITYMVWAPYISFADLDDNLQSNFTIKKVQDNLYEVLPPDNGWFRALPGIKYAILILTNPADHLLIRQLILKAVNPLPAIQELLTDGANVGILLNNDAQKKEDQKKRSESFGEIRAVRMDALQKRPAESKTQFELRRGIVAAQLDELERLLVEADRAEAKFIIDQPGNTCKIVFGGEPIADTSFAESVQQFGKHKDAFGAIGKADDSVLSLRVNHPIDQLRTRNSNKIIDLVIADVTAQLAAATEMTKSQKDASAKLLDGVMQVTRDSIASGNINGFVETFPNKAGDLITYGAVSVTGGQRLNDILALIADSGEGNTFDKAAATVAGVTIHRIAFAEGYVPLFDRLFGVGQESYIGVSDDIVWIGTGSDSLEPLKKAIEAGQKQVDTDVVLQIEGHLLPWARRAKTLVDEMDEPQNIDDRQVRRDQLLQLTQAIDAFSDRDEAKFHMTVGGGKTSGEIFFNTGVLRFIGSQIAAYSRDTLE